MSDKKRFAKSVVIGALCGILASVALMSIFALVLSMNGLISSDAINYIMAGILGTGAFAGGFAAAKINKGAGLVAGAAAGLVIFLFIALAAIIKDSSNVSALIAIKLGACVAGGAAGGALAVKEKKGYRI